MTESKKMKQYTITCNEEQLKLIAHAVEDWARFLAGQCELDHATSMVEPTEDMHKVREILDTEIRPFIVPELVKKYGKGASYSWNGGDCPNDCQRKNIAMGYGIYRQILHFFAAQRKDNPWNVYNSPTLTCKEQGPLIQIKQL